MGRATAAYLAVLVAALCCYAALGAVLSILPRYVPGSLGAGPAAVGLAVGAPALTGLLARPLGGRLGDRLGARAPLIAGAALMAVGAVPAAVSATLAALLIAARVDRVAAAQNRARRRSGSSSSTSPCSPSAPASPAVTAQGSGGVVVPVFAVAVIAARTLASGVPDRLGGRRTSRSSAGRRPSGSSPTRLRRPADRPWPRSSPSRSGRRSPSRGSGSSPSPAWGVASQGAAAGLFFAWFDAGVGLGGPAVGAVAAALGPVGAVVAAGLAVGVGTVGPAARSLRRTGRARR